MQILHCGPNGEAVRSFVQDDEGARKRGIWRNFAKYVTMSGSSATTLKLAGQQGAIWDWSQVTALSNKTRGCIK